MCVWVGGSGGEMSFWGLKHAKIWKKNSFTPNAPQTHLGISHDQNLENSHILGVKNAHFGVNNTNICKFFVVAPNVLKAIWRLPVTKICIFGGQKCQTFAKSNMLLQIPQKAIWDFP